MNSFDIFDSAFSLANLPITDTTNNVIESITKVTNELSSEHTTEVSNSSTVNNSSWLYIGLVFIFLAFAMYVYKLYTNKNRKHVQFDVTTQDCPGGFCPMEKCI